MSKSHTWGADILDWCLFMNLGITADLLPVVCNPAARVSQHSSLKTIGKLPSLYNGKGQVCGIKGWPQKQSTEEEVENWMDCSDYGICIITRNIRAIDIDIDDESIAKDVVSFIDQFLGIKLPCRGRSNSGKRLLAVQVDGDFKKRIINTPNGAIELLATGQQFIAVGTHTSGVPYEWDWREGEEFHLISKDAWDALTDALANKFGTEPTKTPMCLGKMDTNIYRDDTIEFLEDQGLVLDYGPAGQAHIECPFSEEHTTESTPSSTSYFPKGSRGYPFGAFHCFHAHCAERKQGEFVQAIGILQASLENLDKNPTDTDTENSIIQYLSQLNDVEYDKIRKEIADKLNIRVTTLDAERDKLQTSQIPDDEVNRSMFLNIEPWPQAVFAEELLDEIHKIIRQFIICDEHTKTAVTLWITFTWFIENVNVAPIALITAPEKRCGKSQLLSLIGKMVKKPLMASNISPAAVFRVIEAQEPTLLIDEADTFLDNEQSEIRGILNSGHTRDTAYVIRTTGEEHEAVQFSTWGAKAISGIGKRSETIMDRSIILELRRKLPHEKTDRLRHADEETFATIRKKLARLAQDHGELIQKARPTCPEELNDRAQDNWEPLLSIADCVGGKWPRIAREAAQHLTVRELELSSLSTELLSDIRDVFENIGEDKIFSSELIEYLIDDDEKLWATYGHGDKSITPKQVANLLRDYKVTSENIKKCGEVKKGYKKKNFLDAFERYLSSDVSSEEEVHALPNKKEQGLEVA